MFGKILVRYHQTNNGLFIQKRSLNIFTIVPYLVHKLFINLASIFATGPVSTIPEWCWVPFSNMDNPKFLIRQEIVYHVEEIKSLLIELNAHEEWVKGEKKRDENDKYASAGYSKPFYVSRSKIEPVGLDIKDPGDKVWKEALNPKLYGGGRKMASGKGGQPGPDLGLKTTYVDQDYEHMRFAIDEGAYERGAQGVTTYKHNSQGKKGKGGGGNFNPRNRKKQAGESQEGHQARQIAIQNGDDVSDWTPW